MTDKERLEEIKIDWVASNYGHRKELHPDKIDFLISRAERAEELEEDERQRKYDQIKRDCEAAWRGRAIVNRILGR